MNLWFTGSEASSRSSYQSQLAHSRLKNNADGWLPLAKQGHALQSQYVPADFDHLPAAR